MKVFLSHGNASTAQAEQLTARLAAEGIQPVAATSMLQPGENWASAIDREAKSADAFVFMLEPGAERDAWLQDQWRSAIQQSWSGPAKPMIPVLVGDAQLPGFLRDHQAIRVESADDWNRVAGIVAASLRTEPAKEAAGPAEAAQSAERRQRLDEIAQDATKLEPTREELARQVDLLRARIREAGERRTGPVELAELHIELADGLKRLGEAASALPELKAAAELLADHPDAARRLARVRTNLATLFAQLGQKQEARSELERARDLYVKLEGPESLAALVTRSSLVTLLRELGDSDAAAREQAALKAGAKNLVTGFADRIFPPFGRFVGRMLGGKDKKEEAKRDG
jgi:tetratricopeptide (TPR) repeat protein